MKIWNIEEITGYKPKTTFYMDFSIADMFGKKAIQNTYDIAFKSWKDDIEYLTELVMVLNWKIWEHWQNNRQVAELYEMLWEQLDCYCMEHLTGDNLTYYIRTTD